MKNIGTLRAADHILHLAWTPAGDSLAITPSTGDILVADATAGIIQKFPAHGMGNGASAWFHGDLATCGFDGKIRWAGQEWKPGRGMIERVKTSPDGTHLAAGQGRALHIFDKNGPTDFSLPQLPDAVADFVWNPAKVNEVATVGAGGARMWRLGEKEPFARFDWGGASILVDWSHTGRWLATADQTASVHVYDFPRDYPLHIQGFESKVQALAFSADGTRLATGGSPVVTVWPCTGKKGPEGAKPIQVEGHDLDVCAVAFSPLTGQLATGDESGTLLVITFETGQFRRKRSRLASGISALAWHPTLPLLAIGHVDGEVMLLSLA